MVRPGSQGADTRGLKVGCCGFPTSLARYAQIFPVVEVQQTFYQAPMLKTLARWRGQVCADFEFTLKAWQLITHEAGSPTYRRLREKLNERQRREAGSFRLSPTVMFAWERTLECARVLNSRIILFQCPASFAPTRENKLRLRAYFREIRRRSSSHGTNPGLTFVWEPRGEWKPEEVRNACEECDLVHGVDPFENQPTTAGLGYFRLHGRKGFRYRYRQADLESLLSTVRGQECCYVLFNNISMLEDAERFERLTSQVEPDPCPSSRPPAV